MDLIYVLVFFILQIMKLIFNTAQSKDIYLYNSEVSSLKLVQVIFRHAQRNPMSSLGLDLKSESDWPGGFQQLTETGKRQSFELGRYIRNRYNGFLNTTYYYKEIYVRSSDIDRALATAQGVLFGLYPYTENDLTNFGIPIHATQQNNDKIYALLSCPKLKQFIDKDLKTPKVQDILDKNEDIVDYFLKTFGHAEFSFETMYTLGNLRDQKLLLHKIPHDMNEKTFDKLMELLLESVNGLATYNNNDLRVGGPLIKELTNHMTLKKSEAKELKDRKMFIYSFHDIQITSILNILGIDSLDKLPDNVATIFLELHTKTSDDNYYVQLFYRNTTLSDSYELSIPECPAMCSLEIFEKITSTEKFKDLDKLCNLD